ncbi:hypothetical protein GCM10025881_18240 [Pseudolysinimonas kribbensis]|uniref:HTH lacI-type domain-containing protein n=1 Tax=Pseudolysinimonas kribbensis TaxID=433641 RepID=A0ABQ6K5X2_9MICO|nr:hypothetical protein GCM10025881_18240 [Pseudolysinimonas kribbensis]
MAVREGRTTVASRSGAATIAEVAQRAGVSPATVSRVMNGRFVGEPQVAERVRQAAAELDYSPNHLARSLALGETKAIAFLVPDLSNPAFQAVLSSLSKTAAKDGYRVLVVDSGESPTEEPLLAAEARRRCDAIVLCAPRMSEDDLVVAADALRPVVVINRQTSRVSAPTLSIDYRSGVESLARHLYDLGHRHLVFLEGPEGSVSNRARLLGLEDFERSTPDVRLDRLPVGAGSEDGLLAAGDVIATGATAALAFNDLVAVGLIGGLVERGVRVPEDLSVTGFDDIPFARYISPPLTTASVPHEELGVQAWSRMRSLVRHETPEHNVLFQPRLELRKSTAAPRA